MNDFALPYRVLALDGALENAGYAVVETNEEDLLKPLEYGVIHLKESKDKRFDHPRRLAALRDRLLELLRAYQPTAVASEQFFAGENRQTGMLLNRVTGVIMLVVHDFGSEQGREIPIYEYAPSAWKSLAVRAADASKQQIAYAVGLHYGIENLKAGDAADALGIALAHLAENAFMQRRLW